MQHQRVLVPSPLLPHPCQPPSCAQTIVGLKVREVYERITEKEVIPVS